MKKVKKGKGRTKKFEKTKGPSPKDTTFELDNDQNKSLALATNLLSTSVVCVVTDQLTEWYRIRNLETKELSRIDNAPEAIIVTAAENARLLYPTDSFTTKKLESVVETYRTYLSARALPKPFAWKGEPGWALKRLDFQPTKGAHPAWDEFLSRLSDKDAFMAFVWSVFELRNKSRQYLWLWGENGQDGKSTVFRVLAKVLGEAAGALNKTHAEKASQFLLYSFFDKRAVFYPDCKNTKIGMSELLRNLTSGDVCPVEKKHGATTAFSIYLKLFIASNSQPQITDSGADTSRLLLVTIRESSNCDDIDWEERLRSELAEFLYSCRDKYKELCPHHGNIPLNAKSKNLVEESSGADDELFMSIFHRTFVYTGHPCDYVTGLAFREAVTPYLPNDQRIGNFKEWLRRNFKVDRVDIRDIPLPFGKKKIKGYRCIKLASMAETSWVSPRPGLVGANGSGGESHE